MLKKNSIHPLYRQLMEAIIRKIQDGVYQYGDKIPTEPELSRDYNVSRITVRRTIEELCKQGYLEKQQGKGTFVKSPRIVRKLNSEKNIGFSASCRKFGFLPSSHVLSFQSVTPDQKVQHFFRCEKNTSFFCLKRVLSADETPIIYDTIYLPQQMFPEFNSHALENGSLYQYLKESYGVTCSTDSKNAMTSVPAPADIADHLQVAIGEPLMILDSYIEDAKKQPLFYSQKYIAGSRYVLNF